MKKVLSLVVASIMVLSMLAVFALPVAAEVEGPFVVYSDASEYRDDFDPEEDSISPCPGYYYDDEEGLKTVAPDWSKHTPAVGIQTRNTVNLKEGVYIQVRIDKFSWNDNDKWFAFTIYDTQYVTVGSSNATKDGVGSTTLIRPTNDGKAGLAQWYYDNFQWGGQNGYDAADAKHYDDKGNLLLDFLVEWDSSAKKYKVSCCGNAAPESVVNWLTTKFGDDDRAYIGFNAMNKTMGGELEITVLKYGKTAASASAPFGEDSADPVNVNKEIAEPADPSTVPEGDPAIFMNGSKLESDSKSSVKNDGGDRTLTEENYIHYASDRSTIECGFVPKNEVSYNIQDFPVIMVLTRNFCTCESPDGSCYAYETCDMYIMAGDHVAAGPNCLITAINMCYEPIVVGDNSYLYFYVDTTTDLVDWVSEGRFNGARFDINGILYDQFGRNEFDICFMALFRTVEEGEAYVESFIANAEGVDVGGDGKPSETETEESEVTEIDTEEKLESETVVVPEDETTKAPENNDKEDDNTSDVELGCASSVGFGAIAIVALATTAGFVAFKKRR